MTTRGLTSLRRTMGDSPETPKVVRRNPVEELQEVC